MLSATRAAVLILRENGGGPMHYREITEEAIRRSLISVSGPDIPDAVATALYRHAKKAGRRSWFRRCGPGQFELTPEAEHAELRYPTSTSRASLTAKQLSTIHELTWLEAAEVVLYEAQAPLTASEISERILARGLKPHSRSKWHVRSLGNLLASAVRGEQQNGRGSRFRRVSPGRYGLAQND